MNLVLFTLLALVAVQPPPVITGFVTDTQTRAPIAGARVVLVPTEGSLAHSTVSTTDAAGRFVFRVVPTGGYRLVAAHDDYLKQSDATVLTIAPGVTVGPVGLSLTPTGVITGRVLGEFGEPAERVYVRAWRTDGGVAAEGQTNDLGEYRLFGIAPGAVTVGAQRYTAPRLETNLQMAGRGMGPSYVVPTPPCADCRGEGQGMSSIALLTRTGAFIDPRALLGQNSMVVYYPGGTDRAQARALDVLPGARITGIDLQLVVQ